MTSISRWIIALIIAGIFIMASANSFDYTYLLKWKVLTVIVMIMLVLFFLIFRRTLRIKKKSVGIQILDD